MESWEDKSDDFIELLRIAVPMQPKCAMWQSPGLT
jgi:hypothetical protein